MQDAMLYDLRLLARACVPASEPLRTRRLILEGHHALERG